MSVLAPFQEKGCLTGGCDTCGICFAPKQEAPKMTENKHTVLTDALATLGTIIDESAGRDAIHLAVEPVVAGAVLLPGQDIGLENGKAVPRRPYLGVVDPFLINEVQPGQRFWLVVYPRQITSLRHVWSHPAFGDSEPAKATDEDHHVKWMTDWAVKHMSIDYYGEEGGSYSPQRALGNAVEAGHSHSIGPYEDARDHIDSEWWGHWEAITGVKGDRDNYFSCSC